MNLLDLFSGIGGFHLGLKQAGFKFDKVYNSEIDKYARSVYAKQFPEAEWVGSVTDVHGGRIEKPDVITFGSPCQDFSLAGGRKGMDGERSSLIREAIRLIAECRPYVFIWENVKGTFSSNDSADFWAIIQELANIGGYRLQWQLLNTSWFLPQNRERIYLVGSLGDRSKGDIFPVRESKGQTDTTQRKCDNSRTITTAHAHGTAKHMSYVAVPVVTPHRIEKRQNGRRFKEPGDASFTLTGQDQHGVMIGDKDNKRIRRFTPRECERLQGFPDDWTRYGFDGKEISDTQRYKMCGNAVSVPVVKAVGEAIKEMG